MKNILIGLIAIMSLTFINFAIAKDYVIYNISHEFPMGIDGEKLKKNFYISIGENQGVKDGTLLNVYRTISMLDPYKSKKKYDYKVKIGQIEVIHAEDQISIATSAKLDNGDKAPLVEIPNFIIGDQVEVAVD